MLLRQTLRYLPAQLIGPVVQFVSVLAWTHWLPPAAYGTVALVLAAQELVFQLGLSWWSHYTMRYYATLTDEAARARYQAVENAVLALSAAAQALIAWAVLATTAEALTPDLVAATAAYAVGRSLAGHLAERARATGRVAAYTWAQTAGPVLGFAASLAAITWAGPTAAAALGGLAAAQWIVLPLVWRMLALGWRMRLDAKILGAALAYGVPLLVTGALGWVSLNGIRLLVERAEGAAALGLLSVGWGLGHRVISVAAMLVTAAAFPLAVRRMSEAGLEAAMAQVSRNGALLLAVLVPATAGVVWLAEPAVALLVGAEFREMTALLLPAAVLAGAVRGLRVHFADQAFLIAERTGLLFWVNLFEAAAALGLAWVGLRWGGLLGACLGSLAAYAAGAVLCFGLAAARAGLPLPWPAAARVTAATATMLLALSLAGGAPPGALALAGLCLFGALAYGAALALLFRAEIAELRPAAA